MVKARRLLETPGRAGEAAGSSTSGVRPRAQALEHGVFVGRRRELEAINAGLARSGVVALVGPAGIGKSRLARRHVEIRSEPAVFVDIARARDARDVGQAVLSALGVAPSGGELDALAALGPTLARRGGPLVVLDGAAGELSLEEPVARLRAGAPVLITARAPVGLPDHRCVGVGPLPTPPPGSHAMTHAVELFVERARLARPGYAPTEDDLLAIAALVRRLDGVPLAIELAAGRMSVLGPRQIAARLEGDAVRFDRTLRASRHGAGLCATVVDALADLPAPAREALVRWTVFRSDFGAEAAEAVLSQEERPAALDRLQLLRDRGMVRAFTAASASAEVRFSVLGPVAEIAASLSTSRVARAEARSARVAYFVEAADGWRRAAHERGCTEALDKLALEADEISAVLHETLADPGASPSVPEAMLAALEPLYRTRGSALVFARLADSVVARCDGAPTPPLARALLARAWGRRLVNGAEARADVERAVVVARSVGDLALEGRALSDLAVMARMRGSPEAAREIHKEALLLLRSTDDTRALAGSLCNFGIASRQAGRLEEAERCYAESLRAFRDLDNRCMAAAVLAARGVLRRERGEMAGARADLEEAIETTRVYGDPFTAAAALATLASLHQEAGRFAEAAALLEEALDANRESDARVGVGLTLGALGDLHRERGALGEAQASYERALAIACELGHASGRAAWTAALAGVRAELGDPRAALGALTEAETIARTAGDAARLACVALDRALIDAAAARVAIDAGDDDTAVRLRARAAAVADAGETLALGRSSSHARLLRRLLVAAVTRVDARLAARGLTTRLAIGPDAAWFAVDARPSVALAHRRPLRRVLAALASAHRADAATLDAQALLALGWPGERVAPSAGANRVRVAIAELRRLGLNDVIVTEGAAYRFARHVVVVGVVAHDALNPK